VGANTDVDKNPQKIFEHAEEMSVDISDPQIQSAYTTIVRNQPTNWQVTFAIDV
jgi:hypothetical protein